MKKSIITLTLVLTVASLQAQDMQKKADIITELNPAGIRLLHQQASNDIVSFMIFITGGVGNYAADKQGIEQLMLDVMLDGGSKKYPKDEYHKQLEKMGISITANAGYDYTTISIRSLKQYWPQAWDLASSVLTSPAWDEATFEIKKNQTITGLRNEISDPDAFLRQMSMEGIFKGDKYSVRPDGTPESVDALALQDLKEHYSKIMKRKKMLVTAVADLNSTELAAGVAKAFSALPEGEANAFASTPPSITAGITYEPRDIATNYISGVFPAPKLGTRESIAMSVAMQMLRERYFTEVRTKRNLSYAPSAYMAGYYSPFNAVYVSTTDPNQSVQVMTDELRKLKRDGFDEKELKSAKAVYLTSYYMGQETNGAQAATLGRYALRGDYKLAREFNERINSLTLDEVNSVIKTYANDIHWFYLGDKDMVDESIFKASIK